MDVKNINPGSINLRFLVYEKRVAMCVSAPNNYLHEMKQSSTNFIFSGMSTAGPQPCQILAVPGTVKAEPI